MSGQAPSSGEIAGIIAAVVVGLTGLGKGIQWLLTFGGQRADSRAAKLQAWHDELAKREAAFDLKLDGKLAQLEERDSIRADQMLSLRMAFELVAGALRTKDPSNPALKRAEQLLTAAFPVVAGMPPEMRAELRTLDRLDLAATAAARRTEVDP